ncbi:MAG: prenyltransferase/squalene oxidase repeat-containing protein [Desulfobulbaceae bacterium]|jgi:hypothetical protein|nr:prenyltransferase/squalene oxidase repeat-containing protein [Desulfobulbaceae bacterium]
MCGDEKLQDILTAAAAFVLSRRKDTGGFGATPRLPATIQDTYHALQVLDLAQRYNVTAGMGLAPATDVHLRSYLDRCRRSLTPGAATTFHMLWCCRVAGLAVDGVAVEAMVTGRMGDADALDDWYYWARILVEVLERKPALFPDDHRLAAVLDRAWRGVDEAWMHMYLHRLLRNSLPQAAPKLIAWFRASQNGDGGFGFFPGTTSFVENCHYGLQALKILGAEPADPEKARRFVTSCQTASGGFGRGLRAAPFLDATWHAVAALELLN